MVEDSVSNEKHPADSIAWDNIQWNSIIPRLLVFAKSHKRTLPGGASLPSEEDLVSSAIEKTLSGVRRWKPENVGLTEHLFGVIRSDLYNETRKHMNWKASDVAIETVSSRLSSADLSPEEAVIHQSVLKAFLSQLEEKDQDLFKWFTLSALYGLSQEEATEAMGLDRRKVANMRRRFRRHAEAFSQSDDAIDNEVSNSI